MKSRDWAILWIVAALVLALLMIRTPARSQEATAIPGIFFVEGGWAVCRRDIEYHTLHSLRHSPERWLRSLSIFERAQICTVTLEDDIVIIGPSGVPNTVQMAFQDRPDVAPFISFFLYFEAIYDLPDGLVWFDYPQGKQ